MYVFNGQEKLIYLQSGVVNFEVKDLYSKWKDWVYLNGNSKYQSAFQTIGGEPISDILNVAPYYFLTNGWKIRPFEINHNLAVDGNLFVDGGQGNPFVNTTGNYNVMINLSTSNNAVVVQNTQNLTNIERKIDDLTALSL